MIPKNGMSVLWLNSVSNKYEQLQIILLPFKRFVTIYNLIMMMYQHK